MNDCGHLGPRPGTTWLSRLLFENVTTAGATHHIIVDDGDVAVVEV